MRIGVPGAETFAGATLVNPEFAAKDPGKGGLGIMKRGDNELAPAIS